MEFNSTLKLFESFNEVIYYDEPHHYFINDQKLISTTTLLSHYHGHFESDVWAPKKADDYGLTVDQVLRAWEFGSDFSQYKGSFSHIFAENLINNKVFPYELQKVIDFFGYDAIGVEYKVVIEQVKKFHADSLGKLIPVKTELVVYDKSIGLSGMVDLPAYNKKTGKLEIWDWKTSKKIAKENCYQKMFHPISHLDDCEHVHYSLQLNIYKYIIRKITGIDVGDCYLIWINEKNPTYEIIKCLDLQKEVEDLINHALAQGILKNLN